jgi:hypothetical protein
MKSGNISANRLKTTAQGHSSVLKPSPRLRATLVSVHYLCNEATDCLIKKSVSSGRGCDGGGGGGQISSCRTMGKIKGI